LDTGQAWGPVLFKVVQTTDDVKLVAVNVQQPFDTASVVKPSTSPPVQSFNFEGPSIFQADPTKALQFNIVAAQPVESVDSNSVTLIKDNLPYGGSPVTLTLQPDRKTIIVNLSPGPSPGSYAMTVPYSTKPGETARSESSIPFTVH
jgi:hypothetical protein